MKNCTATRSPRIIPVVAGRRFWRTSISSRQATTRGGITPKPIMRWASVRLTNTRGENP